ncbi:MAG: peptide deformylase [SAR86 cluster bacterium]|jgi:peptide deformylase
MAVLKILIFPDQRLRTVAKEVLVIDDEIKALVSNLLETMYEGNGIGLSATQVNIHKRILVVDITDEKDSPLVLINPKIKVLNKEEKIYSEGCLSVPGFFEEVSRPSEINITALNIEGERFTIMATDLLAVAVQHEMDHLDGKIFVDFLSNLKRQRIKSKLLKISKAAV